MVEESSEDLIALSNAMSLEGLSPTNRTAGESSGTSSEMEMEGVDSRPSAPGTSKLWGLYFLHETLLFITYFLRL